MSLHNQESQHVTNKTSSSLLVNQSTAGAVSMAKQIAKSVAPSIQNKYSTLNINNQFKGKGIEPQHKAAVLRPAPTGMQTLGKAVAARRMPPPTHLPSLRTFNSSPTQSVESVSNENSSGSQNCSSQSAAPTIAAVVSGSPWIHDSNSNASFEPNAQSFNRNNSINQEDFPKLDEAVQQNAAKCKSDQAQEAAASDEPVFKPANLGNWSARMPVQSVDEQQASETVRPVQAQSPSTVQSYIPNRPQGQYRPNKFQQAGSQTTRKYPAETKNDEYRRPFLFNKNDTLAETNNKNVTDPNKIDFSNLDENNWAMISDRVDYDEKLDFDDNEEGEKGSDNGKHELQVDFEEQQWEDKRKEKQEEVDKNLERAKLRRDQEIKKLNQEIRHVSINDDETSVKEFNQRERNFKNNQSNKQSNRNNTNNRSINNSSRKNDDQMEPGSRQNSRYHASTNQNHQSQSFPESIQNDKSEKTPHHQIYNNQRQNFHSQQNFQNHSNRYHQSNNSQPNTKASGPNPRYQNKKPDSNQTSELRPQSEQKKSLKQLSHNVPEIESKLQPLGSKKLPIQTNQTQGQSQSEKKIDKDSRSNNNDNAEPKINAWNRNQNELNQDSQTKQAQSKQEPKTKYQQRNNQPYRNARRRYEDNYGEDYDDDYDDYTEEDEDQFSQNNSNRTGSGAAFTRRPNTSNLPQSYKRGSTRRSNDYYEMDSKNQYYQYPNRYYNYDYNYPKGYSANYNFRGGNSRNSAYPSGNKVFYNSNTKNSSAKEPKESVNRSRDQTSMTKYSEHTDAEMHDEWETASDTSLRHQVKKMDEPKQNATKDAPKSKNQSQKQTTNKKANNQKDFRSRKTSSANNPNPNDPRYTAKYWSDNSKNDKTNEQKNQENRTKNTTQSKNGQGNQGRVNLQVYRVDKIVADDPEAIKEALKNQNIKEKSASKSNPLSGIDLNNRAGVVIVDYIPESDEIAVADENSAEDEEKDDDDGFQKVKTKRDKKAEKLKAQAEAAAAAAAKVNSAHAAKKKESRNSKKSALKTELKAGKANKAGIMNNIQTWKNDMAKSGAKTISQIVRSAPVKAESRTRSLPDDLKKKTNAWENSGPKVETNAKLDNFIAEKKTILNELKPSDNVKTKDETKDIVLVKQDTIQPSQKNICTVKPTKQVTQPLAVEPKGNINVSVSNSIQNTGSGVVSPSNNQQDSQSMNKYYDKILINQTTSSAAVAASAAAAAAAVVAVTVTSIQQQQIPNAEQTEQNTIKQSNSSSSIQNQSGSNVSNHTEIPNQTNNTDMSQMAPNQTSYNFAPGSTTSQTSLISSPSQANSQLSATSLIHSLSINHTMPPQYIQQNIQPIFQPMVQPFMSQSRAMVAPPQQQQPPQSQSVNPIIQNQQNKSSFNSLFDLNLGEFSGKDGMFYTHGPPHPQNYLGPMVPPPHQPPMPHIQAQSINPYQNGFDHNQFFNPKILNNKPNGAYVQPPPPPPPAQMPNNQFNGINSNQVKSQFNQNTSNQLINQMHQYNKQEYAYFNNQMAPGQNFGQTQAGNQATQAPNTNNLGYFMSQIGNLNANQFQAQPHVTSSAQQSVFNMNHGQLSNNQLFGLGYNQQQQNSQFNLSNLIQTPQNQPQSNQTSSHRQTPLSIPSSPFIQTEGQQDNCFTKQQNGFEVNYKPQQPNQTNYMRNSSNLASTKQMFSSLDANCLDKNQLLNQSSTYYRSIDQSIQNHFNQVGLIPPQQQPPLLPNPPTLMHNQMPNQIQPQSINNKMNFTKTTNMARYPNAYQNQSRPQMQSAPYFNNQNYNRRSYPNQTSYQNNGKKMPCIDAKLVQKNPDLAKQSKQDVTQSGHTIQSQTRDSTPNTNEDKNECNTNVI